VTNYFGGSNPGSSIIVNNVQAASGNYIFSGAANHRGIAVYDGAGTFWIIQMECP
jgi:hypothetical protein